jgi:sugar phosphate isomerase/epimerase
VIRLSGFADEISPHLDEQVATLEREGIHYVDLRGVSGTNVLDLTDEQIARIKRTLDDYGIGVAAIASPIGKVPIDSAFDEHLQRFERGMARYAAAHGIQILIETHDPAWSRSANVVALTAAAGTPSVGILYDVLHPCRMGEPVEQTLSTLGRNVELVHVKDGHRPPDGSQEWPLCALGAGDVPLDRIVATLQEQGYDGWYTFEWEKRWHPELAEPEIALPAGSAFVRALAASV